jgi:hypothetical protein
MEERLKRQEWCGSLGRRGLLGIVNNANAVWRVEVNKIRTEGSSLVVLVRKPWMVASQAVG